MEQEKLDKNMSTLLILIWKKIDGEAMLVWSHILLVMF